MYFDIALGGKQPVFWIVVPLGGLDDVEGLPVGMEKPEFELVQFHVRRFLDLALILGAQLCYRARSVRSGKNEVPGGGIQSARERGKRGLRVPFLHRQALAVGVANVAEDPGNGGEKC